MKTLRTLGLVALAAVCGHAAEFGLGIHVRSDSNGFGFHVPIKHNEKFSSVVSVDFSLAKEDYTLSGESYQTQDTKAFGVEYALYREVYSREALSGQVGFCLGVSKQSATLERWSGGGTNQQKLDEKGYHFGPRTNIEYSFSKHVSLNWGVGLLYGHEDLTRDQDNGAMILDGTRKRFYLDSNLSLRVYF